MIALQSYVHLAGLILLGGEKYQDPPGNDICRCDKGDGADVAGIRFFTR